MNVEVKGASRMFVLLRDILNFWIRVVGLVGGMKYIEHLRRDLTENVYYKFIAF